MLKFKSIVPLTVLCTLLVECVGLRHFKNPFKNFRDSLYECAQYFEVSNCTLEQYIEECYPDTDEVRQLVRCAMVNLGAWEDDASGVLEHVMRNHFEPAPGDSCYEKRTRNCIECAMESQPNLADKAYDTFMCYYHQYGNIVETRQFVPLPMTDFYQLMWECFRLMDPSTCEIIQYLKDDAINQPHFPRGFLLGCLRAGFYSMESGLIIQNMYTQFGHSELVNPQLQECCDRIVREYCGENKATVLYYQFKLCFQPYTPILSWFLRLMRTYFVDLDECSHNCTGYKDLLALE